MSLRHVSKFIRPALSTTHLDACREFSEALAHAGIPCSEPIIADGKLHRYKTDGDHSENCWYVLHDDSLSAGAFGCWKRGLSETWCAFSREALSEEDQALITARINKARADRKKAEAENRDAARSRAAEIWNTATPAVDHDYLTKKGIKPHGARVYEGRIVLPLRDAASELQSLQFIDTEGDKRFLTGGRVAGFYFSLGAIQGAAALCIAEGFATGATIHEATGYPVAVAFNAGNLLPVARALRAKFPELRLILCADDDHRTNGNPGITKATEAARSIGGLLAIPDFGNDRPDGATDFNDMAALSGQEAVSHTIENATAPAGGKREPGDSSTRSGEQWPEPQPLTAKVDPEPYPLDALPDTIRAAVEEVRGFTKAPVSLVASSALAALSLAIQSHADAKRAEKLTGPVSLFLLTIADSGERKSTVDGFFTKAIRDYEETQAEAAKPALKDHSAAVEATKAISMLNNMS